MGWALNLTTSAKSNTWLIFQAYLQMPKQRDILSSVKICINTIYFAICVGTFKHFISFDHDLADVVELKEELPIEQWFDLENNKEYTGMDCAKWLVNYCLDNNKPLSKYAVHSANPAGA